MYCNRGSLATEETVLQYSLVGSRFVLQYKLYCEPGVGLCRDTARARQPGAQGARGARRQALGLAAGELGAQQTRAPRVGRPGSRRSGLAWQAQAERPGQAAAARGTGAARGRGVRA